MAVDDQTQPADDKLLCRRILVTGVVQGVGFRPFVWRLATSLGLGGWVENDSSGVTIEVEGNAAGVAAFERGLATSPPPRAHIERIDAQTRATTEGPRAPGQPVRFTILDSHRQAGAVTSLPADIATCAACLAEVRGSTNRRHQHPFANCTDCGPRFTIIRTLPYDRTATTLAPFPLCADCAGEYADPADRRFHAQPVSCPACGPIAWFAVAPAKALERPAAESTDTPTGAAAIAAARARLRQGEVIAIKGIGGFHLSCDATNAKAVGLLRARKHRPSKPLAVMVASAAECRPFAVLADAERRLLESPERPIVLVRKRGTGAPLAESIAPGIGHVGVMLPSFPLHWLLLDPDAGLPMPPLVMTSGNLSEAPIEHANDSAVTSLGPLVDGFLTHDRDIHAPCDDSVVRVAAGHLLPLRRSRGYAPLPIRLADDGPDLVAIGGELKSTICVARGDHAWMSQHLGDPANPGALATLERTVRHFLGLFSVRPMGIVADLHPGYLSTGLARSLACELGVPLLQVQHHRAHAASLLADFFATRQTPPTGPLLVAAFDGSGYLPGPRGDSIAGSEFFRSAGVAEGAGAGLTSCARLASFLLPGGDAAVLHPWRTALALLHAAGIPWKESLAPVRAAGKATPILRRQLERAIHSPPTTSMGRLFDGVAAILDVRQRSGHEGDAAMALEELAADAAASPRSYAFTVESGEEGPFTIEWRGLVASIVADIQAEVSPRDIAAGFHLAVARMIADVADAVAAADGHGQPLVVGLTGGVFQNALLVERTFSVLTAAGHDPFCHRLVPPNDGGIALGQIILARESLRTSGSRL